MPIYEYRCDNGHTFEVMQRITDDPVSLCSTCEAPVQRVFHPVAVHFKGSGFYNTDYGTRKRTREQNEGGSSDAAKDAGSSTNGSAPKSDAGGKAKPDSAPAAKPAAKSD